MMRREINKQPSCILFNGLGGAGQRHLRIFSKLIPETRMIGARRKGKTPPLNPDFTVSNSASLEEIYSIEFLDSIEDAYEQKPDLVVISSPTANHAKDIIQAIENGADVFVEKPGAANLLEAKSVADAIKKNGSSFFISYQRRFHPLIKRLEHVLSEDLLGEIMSIKIDVNSYVPDWHPYEDFMELYACKKSLGGGVLRTEIHEIDLLLWLFGSPVELKASGGCLGPFELDVEDTAEVILDYGNFIAKANLCFMNKSQSREIKIKFEKGFVHLDFMNNTLIETNEETGVTIEKQDHVENDWMFEAQAKYFLNNFEKNDQSYLNSLLINSNLVDTCLNQIKL